MEDGLVAPDASSVSITPLISAVFSLLIQQLDSQSQYIIIKIIIVILL